MYWSLPKDNSMTIYWRKKLSIKQKNSFKNVVKIISLFNWMHLIFVNKLFSHWRPTTTPEHCPVIVTMKVQYHLNAIHLVVNANVNQISLVDSVTRVEQVRPKNKKKIEKLDIKKYRIIW